MNARATLAAEGLPRRAFTVDDVFRMVEVGLIAEDERVELIGGELVPMSPKGSRHEAVKRNLIRACRTRLPAAFDVMVETTLPLDDHAFVEPDVLIVRASTRVRDFSPATALLVVEIADSSLGYDLGRKPAIYASHGLVELWVIDAVARVTHVHRQPMATGFADVTVHSADSELRAAFVPELAFRLADMPLED